MPAIKGLEWTFDTAAQTYAKLRPGYPRELYDDIFSRIALDTSCNAIEIGIGGGQATQPILDTGCRVVAVEYGKNLTELCREKFRAYPNFTAVNARFEDYPGEDGCCDLIYSASAFHWIPEEIGYSKVYAMLKHDGLFARFANHPGADLGHPDLWNAIQALYAIYMPDSPGPKPYTAEKAEACARIAAKYGFIDIEYRLYHRTRDFSAAEYKQLMSTYSNHIVLEEATRREFFDRVGETIDAHGGTVTIYDTIDLQVARKP